MNATNEVYILEWDLSHLGDDIYDAELIKFSGWENTVGLALTEDYFSLPQKVYFEANFQTLNTVDFPYNNVRWPIMSKRMLSTLLAVGSFPNKATPIVMVNDTFISKARYDEQGIANPGVENYEFVAVQLLNHIEALDRDHSVCEIDEESLLVIDVEYLVLKKPQEGFPPLFRLAEYPVLLFVSSSGRLALENAGIQGVLFESLADFQLR
ncbi:hypothetical protein H6F77_02715 [Microcoleus sp. FACHB-831]|uniref:hypothetical protein n=1 Tax=Microcoleus sp. FACHB-831 TaxID=2692827 RepID=UPI001684CA17|nr:hypothetical protein [Microcoleus sp. FACHB-831]MBD1920029.1 hypothetical protein [Microcoleus sp. FACHB-831]